MIDPVRIGPIEVWPPVVLAPMAGVTNAPFRRLCRSFGAGLYVSEMITARGLADGSKKSWLLARFADDEDTRSIQLYGTEPRSVGIAVERLAGEGRVDHVDLNFGCPAPKITRHGGGAALPWRTDLYRSIVAAAVAAAGPVPVTVKLRVGIDPDHLTHLEAGRIAEGEGAAAVALHARTAEQLYSGDAEWWRIAELKEAVRSVPVLGNGDVWEGADAIRMMAETGCDGVVVGRGCLGRPWLFRDLVASFEGREVSPAPTLGDVTAVMTEHARLLTDWRGQDAIRDFRKHTAWYVQGYGVPGPVRQQLSRIGSLDELEDLAAGLDAHALPRGTAWLRRGHRNGPRPVALPHRWLDRRTGTSELSAEADALVSGG